MRSYSRNGRTVQVFFPHPIEPYVHESVLIETFEEGVGIAHYLNVEHPARVRPACCNDHSLSHLLTRLLTHDYAHIHIRVSLFYLQPALARMGLTTFLKMLLVDNFIHADCHAENILVRFDEQHKPELVRDSRA